MYRGTQTLPVLLSDTGVQIVCDLLSSMDVLGTATLPGLLPETGVQLVCNLLSSMDVRGI